MDDGNPGESTESGKKQGKPLPAERKKRDPYCCLNDLHDSSPLQVSAHDINELLELLAISFTVEKFRDHLPLTLMVAGG